MNDIDEDTTLARELLPVLRRTLDLPDLGYAEPPTPMGGGFWADILAVRLTGAPPELSGDLVVRVMPDDLLGRRETVVQREVASQGFPAPIVRLAGDARDGLGRAYMVMDRAHGTPLLSGLTAGNAIVSLPRVARRLPHVLASTALELHLLDAQPVVDALQREVPDASIDTNDMLSALATAAETVALPELARAVTWLVDRQPEPERVSVCHGDLHPLNLLVDDDEHVTLIDWTASRVSEPAFDLAFTMLMIREAPLDVPAWLRRPLHKVAAWLARRVLDTYRTLAAPHGIVVDDDRLAWHTALQCTRVLMEVESWGPGDRAGHPFAAMADSLRSQLAAIVAT